MSLLDTELSGGDTTIFSALKEIIVKGGAGRKFMNHFYQRDIMIDKKGARVETGAMRVQPRHVTKGIFSEEGKKSSPSRLMQRQV